MILHANKRVNEMKRYKIHLTSLRKQPIEISCCTKSFSRTVEINKLSLILSEIFFSLAPFHIQMISIFRFIDAIFALMAQVAKTYNKIFK